MSNPMTSKELSLLTGLSTSTISRVLNHPDLVNRETREKVYAAIEKYSFSVSTQAQSRKKIIGLTISDAHSLFSTTMISAMSRHLVELGINLLIINLGKRTEAGEYFKQHREVLRKIDGLIIACASLNEEGADFLRKMGVPSVVFNSRCKHEVSILSNNYIGGQDAARYIIGKGYRAIAFVGWKPVDENVMDRWLGFETVMREAGIEISNDWKVEEDLSVDGGYRATERLFALDKKPKAIFYSCDAMAAGGFKWLNEHGIHVPTDVGIMGFDDLEIAQILGLTTMSQFVESKIDYAINNLIERIKGQKDYDGACDEISISPRLVVRNSL